MREIELQEIESVSGGWEAVFHLGFADVTVSGEEFGAAYDWAVEQATDFFCWWDPHGYFERTC